MASPVDSIAKWIAGILPRIDSVPEPSRSDAIGRSDATLIAEAASYTVAFLNGETVEVHRQRIDVGTTVVSHEALLLLPVYPGLGVAWRHDECDVAVLTQAADGGGAVVIRGAARMLDADYHRSRFPGVERVLAINVNEVLGVYASVPTVSLPPANPTPEIAEHRLEAPDALDTEMRLVRINVSMPTTIEHDGAPVSTGIFKRSVDGPVAVRFMNIAGDGQADLRGHGGTFRAIYAYPTEHYEYWAKELGRSDLEPGQFGENFTVLGMLDDDVNVGDRFRIGTATVEVSQPRVPCFKLAIKMGIENFQTRFLREGRVGFYLRVLEEGTVSAGDHFELLARDPNGMSVRAISDLLYFDTQNIDATRRSLSIAALSHGWKESFEERLNAAARAGFREFVVKRKIQESETITSFYLEPRDREPLSPFVPGQFLTFRLSIPGSNEPVIRTYSLSDSPQCPYYRVSIKREAPPPHAPDAPPGLSSSFFHDHVEPGTVLEVGAPRGAFVVDDDPRRTLVLLSAGVGITPLLSMLNATVASGRRIWFIHGARNGREHAFAEHVRCVASRHRNVSAHVAYSAPDEADVAGRDYDSQGRVTVDLLKRILPFDDYAFHMVGPPAFMKDLYAGLRAMGVEEDRVRYEFFGPALMLEDNDQSGEAVVNSVEGGTEVIFAESDRRATWSGEGTLLELAEGVGLNPSYSCRAGICQTCRCRVLEGEVDYDEALLVLPEEGTALICVAKPNGRVVLDV